MKKILFLIGLCCASNFLFTSQAAPEQNAGADKAQAVSQSVVKNKELSANIKKQIMLWHSFYFRRFFKKDLDFERVGENEHDRQRFKEVASGNYDTLIAGFPEVFKEAIRLTAIDRRLKKQSDLQQCSAEPRAASHASMQAQADSKKKIEQKPAADNGSNSPGERYNEYCDSLLLLLSASKEKYAALNEQEEREGKERTEADDQKSRAEEYAKIETKPGNFNCDYVFFPGGLVLPMREEQSQRTVDRYFDIEDISWGFPFYDKYDSYGVQLICPSPHKKSYLMPDLEPNARSFSVPLLKDGSIAVLSSDQNTIHVIDQETGHFKESFKLIGTYKHGDYKNMLGIAELSDGNLVTLQVKRAAWPPEDQILTYFVQKIDRQTKNQRLEVQKTVGNDATFCMLALSDNQYAVIEADNRLAESNVVIYPQEKIINLKGLYFRAMKLSDETMIASGMNAEKGKDKAFQEGLILNYKTEQIIQRIDTSGAGLIGFFPYSKSKIGLHFMKFNDETKKQEGRIEIWQKKPKKKDEQPKTVVQVLEAGK